MKISIAQGDQLPSITPNQNLAVLSTKFRKLWTCLLCFLYVQSDAESHQKLDLVAFTPDLTWPRSVLNYPAILIALLVSASLAMQFR